MIEREPLISESLKSFRSVIAVVPWKMEEWDLDQVIHDRDSSLREVAEHFATSGRRRRGA